MNRTSDKCRSSTSHRIRKPINFAIHKPPKPEGLNLLPTKSNENIINSVSASNLLASTAKELDNCETSILPTEENIKQYVHICAAKVKRAYLSSATGKSIEEDKLILAGIENIIIKAINPINITQASTLIKLDNIHANIQDMFTQTCFKAFTTNYLSFTQSDNCPTVTQYSYENIQKTLSGNKFTYFEEPSNYNMNEEEKTEKFGDGCMLHRQSIKKKSNVFNIQNKRSASALSYTYNLSPNLVDIKPYIPPWMSCKNTIFVRINELLLYQNIEPIFGNIAIYNINLKKKITETFYVDISSKENAYLSTLTTRDFSNTANSFIFSYGDHDINDLYILIRLEKILDKGDLSKVMAYYEIQNHDAKIINKVKNNMMKLCENLYDYRMPIGWIYFSLSELLRPSIIPKSRRIYNTATKARFIDALGGFDTSKKSESDLTDVPNEELIATVFSRAEDFDMNDENMYKYMYDSKIGQVTNKKNRIFHGTLNLEAFRIPPIIPRNCFDSLLKPLIPSTDDKISSDSFKPNDKIVLLETFPSSKYPSCHNRLINRLFIYPKSLNCSLRPNNVKNLQVLFFVLNQEKALIQDILDHINTTPSSEIRSTSIQYHNRSPYFYEELKFDLPDNISPKSHLLIVVRAITISKLCIASTYIIGFSWIPLFKKNIITTGYFELPITAEDCPQDYSSYFPNESVQPIRWLDNKKPFIGLKIKLFSSIYTKCPTLRSSFPIENNLLNIPRPNSDPNSASSSLSGMVSHIQAIDLLPNLLKVKPKVLIEYFYVISNYILSLIDILMPLNYLDISNEQSTLACLKAFYILVECVSVVSQNTKYLQDDLGRNYLLGAYTIWFSCNTNISNKSESKIKSDKNKEIKDYENLYKSIAGLIILSFEENNVATKILINPWFYFELILKSLMISWNSKPDKETSRFMCEKSFVDSLVSLLTYFIKQIHSYIKLNLIDNICMINSSISRFLLDLFFIIDRGAVYYLLRFYVKNIKCENYTVSQLLSVSALSCFICNDKVIMTDLAALNILKITFEAENFSKQYFTLPKNNYNTRFQMFPMILDELKLSFSRNIFDSSFELFVNSILRMLWRFELLEDKVSCDNSIKEQNYVSNILNDVACLLYPFMFQIFDLVATHLASEGKSITKYEKKLPSIGETGTVRINSKISYQTISTIVNMIGSIGLKTVQAIFFIFLWIIRAMKFDLLLSSWNLLNDENKLKCVDTLSFCLQIFPFVEDSSISNMHDNYNMKNSQGANVSKREALKEMILNSSAKREQTRENRTAGSYRSFIKLAKSKSLKPKEMPEEKSTQIINSYLNIISSETTFFMLNMIINETKSVVDKQPILAKCLQVITKLLLEKQTITLHTNVLVSLQVFIKKFSVILFESFSETCSNLVGALITLCKSPINDIRENASEILFVMIKMNYKINKNLSRMAYLITSAIFNSIANECKNIFTVNLQHSLLKIIRYAIHSKKYPIKEDINNIFQNLISFIKDSTRISEINDLYSKIDLMHEIIGRLGSMPDLRIHWLLQIKDILLVKDYILQAAFCALHAAIVSFQHLSTNTGKLSYLPYGLSIFKNITSNYNDEYFSSSDYINSDGFSYSSKFLTEKGFIMLINQSINLFTKAKAHNYVILLSDIVYRTYQSSNQFSEAVKFSEIHIQALNSIDKQGNISDICAYFRVAFYGVKCGPLNQQEFIYSEPPHTKLSQFFDSMIQIYQPIFPPNSLEIIKDSAPVEIDKLNSEMCYIQITYVYPFSFISNRENTKLPFEFAQDYKYFYYITPFTSSGKARGELLDQYQRKTIVEIEKYFPHTLLRQKIISIKEEIISPVDVIISDISKRARDLEKVFMEYPLDIKILQLNLQGCVGVTVNQGAFEAARVFLEPFINSESKYNPLNQETLIYLKGINSLQLTCQFLLDTCGKALMSVENIDAPLENIEYWEHMAELYNTFNYKLSTLLNNVKSKLKNIFILST